MQYIKVNDTYEFVAVSFFIILVLLGWMIDHNYPPFIQFEQKITQLFQQRFGHPQMNYSDGPMNSVLSFLATYGSPTFISIMTIFIALILFIKIDIALIVWFLGVVSTGGIFGLFIKKIFRRNRPIKHLPFDTGHSFPSGHAIASTLFFLAILLVFLPMVQSIVIRLVLMALVSFLWGGILFSRMYFHAHHIGDLFAGVSLGIFWVLTSMGVYNYVVSILSFR